MLVEFAALLPSLQKTGRLLCSIDSQCMQWHRFEAVRTMTFDDTRLGDLDWRGLVKFIIAGALRKIGLECAHYDVTAELWSDVVTRARLLSPDDLRSYLQEWSKFDPVVAGLVAGTRSTTKECADLGGWLADYCNTVLRVAMRASRADVKYVVVDNQTYASLARHTITPLSASGLRRLSVVDLGDIWETLVWHAYERDRPEFVMALLFATITSSDLSVLPSSAAAVAVPPPPPAPAVAAQALRQ